MSLLVNLARFSRRWMADRTDTLAFTRRRAPPPGFRDNTAALYVHIPFCRSLCPYCPYNKMLYERAIAARYTQALRREIARASELYGRLNIESLYFGGGTPALMLEELGAILEDTQKYFSIGGPVAIETTPSEVTQETAAAMLRSGFGLISVGVQSFQNRFLRQIGRQYDAPSAGRACAVIRDAGFATFNIDLIFAFQGQSIEDVRQDLLEAIRHRSDQITCYPLLTFPYTSVGRWMRRNNVVIPKQHVRWEMYRAICAILAQHGYSRSSVWSFVRGSAAAFSSVTRDYYLGFGAGAASYNGQVFSFNTFSPHAYIADIESGSFPTAIGMPVSERLERMFWLYWRLYETRISKARYRNIFCSDFEHDFPGITRLLRALRFVEEDSAELLTLNTRGCHWVHLAQNILALNDINTVWTAARSTPFPEKIRL